MNRKNKGFTLMELLAAVIVLGIIGSIVMPIYTRITNEAKDNLFRDNVKSLVKNIKSECNSYLGFVESMNECASTDRLLENIIAKAELLKQYHEKRFDKSIKKYDKGIDR